MKKILKSALLVEDCEITAQMTKFLLNKLGFNECFIAKNTKEFYSILDTKCMPNIVITDWNIENNFKGSDVISAVTQKFNDIPIAIVSSQKIDISSNHCKWFPKPLNIKDLIHWLDTIYDK